VIIGVGKTKSKTTIFHPKLPNSPFPTKKPEPEKEKKKKKIQAKITKGFKNSYPITTTLK
jgi:hypothetical protein